MNALKLIAMGALKAALLAAAVAIHGAAARAAAAEAQDGPVLTVPEGFTIELVAGPPLCKRPIVGAFDEAGRLYVAESSGSNDPVEKQLAERPHRVIRLEDADGDGRYDKRTVFADRMMFPEGAMWLDGSLYVSAPPTIWKLTDRDGDGVAEERVEWFRGKTLTGCANDLHGPYAGPDGWVYWCKGAFAEQTHIVNGRPWKTEAAHIFRCRPDGSGFEPVMTGGMDNPVDVVFTPEGERIFSATYLETDSRRDGLAHAIYGGVYGKQHNVLDGHPRTGPLMPGLVMMNPAAPCGLERYESDAFGEGYRDNLFTCQFNFRKVSRHVLRPEGSSFASEDSDFVVSDHVDFHPTDVLMDADGSLLVIDTGGWYKLCCPTSQLWKPEVLGGIYRVRRTGAAAVDDPRGLAIQWPQQSLAQLWTLMSDARPAVRQRAVRTFALRGGEPEMRAFLQDRAGDVLAGGEAGEGKCDPHTAALARAWALVQIETGDAQQLVRQLLTHPDEAVRHVALQGVSLHRDVEALQQVLQVLEADTPAMRRLAAETLGRLGNRSAVEPLLAAADRAEDRIGQHSITYALIELADAAKTAQGLASHSPGTLATALVALDQMPGGGIEAEQVIPLLNDGEPRLAQTALWLVAQHPQWGGKLANWLSQQLGAVTEDPLEGKSEPIKAGPLEALLVRFAGNAEVQKLLADAAESTDRPQAARRLALRVMAAAGFGEAPAVWPAALARVAGGGESELVPLAVEAARKLPAKSAPEQLRRALLAVADDSARAPEVRVAALAVVAAGLPGVSEAQFSLLAGSLSDETAVVTRSAAADALAEAPLSADQLMELCDRVQTAGPLELNRLLGAFARGNGDELGLRLLAALRAAPALPSLRVDLLRQTLANYSPAVQEGVNELESLVNVDATAQRARIEELLPQMAGGDVRRGHVVFHSSKASCSACHRMGIAGGVVGPDLSHIGEARTERDLLESILFPSLSFVRSYESVLILTTEGKALNGRIRDETDQEYILVTGPNEETRVRRDDVEEIQPSTVSVMPAGLDKQLSPQELADLVAFLKNAK